jgi:hypothetical protein
VVASPDVGEEAKTLLRTTYLELNPAELKRQIAHLQERLLRINQTKPQTKEVRSPANSSPGRKHSWREISRTSLVRQPEKASRTS